jgi:hypothetical protein
MHVLPRDKLKDHVEVFLGIGILYLLVAALHWHGHTKGGWGNWTDWLGRGIDSVACVVLIGLLHWMGKKRRWSWKITVGVPTGLLVILWAGFAITTISMPYVLFLIVSALLLGYSLLLSAFLILNWRKEEINSWICPLVSMIDYYCRTLFWVSSLFVGTMQTWIEIQKHVKGPVPYILLFLFLFIIALLYIEALKPDHKTETTKHT